MSRASDVSQGLIEKHKSLLLAAFQFVRSSKGANVAGSGNGRCCVPFFRTALNAGGVMWFVTPSVDCEPSAF